MSEENKNNIVQDDEIDLVELVKTIWGGRRFIAKVTVAFLILGLVVAFTNPIEYEANCKLLPESSKSPTSGLGSLSGIAGIAGLDLSNIRGSGTSVLTPKLYPEIANSLPFLLKVINDSIYFEQEKLKTTSLFYFKEISKPSLLALLKTFTIGLPNLLFKRSADETFRTNNEDEFYRLSKTDWNLIQDFGDRIFVELDELSGILEIKVKMPDPYAAANLAKNIEQEITSRVVKHQTERTSQKLKFTQKIYDESKSEFEKVQLKLARVMDRNRNITTAMAEIEKKNIEHEYDLAFNVYKNLSSELERSKLELRTETPIFTTLEPVRIPESKKEPRRKVILIISTILGIFLSVVVIFIKKYIIISE